MPVFLEPFAKVLTFSTSVSFGVILSVNVKSNVAPVPLKGNPNKDVISGNPIYAVVKGNLFK